MEAPTKPATRPRISRRPEEWRDIFVRFEQSGQTREQFCAEQNLGLSTFSRWRQRLRGEGAKSSEQSSDGLFVELSHDAPVPSGPSWDAELLLGTGVVLRIRRPAC